MFRNSWRIGTFIPGKAVQQSVSSWKPNNRLDNVSKVCRSYREYMSLPEKPREVNIRV